jgi:octaprenyl-diphosphate synthase
MFQTAFENELKSNNEIISSVNQHILKKRGKQIRPLLTLLSAKSVGDINDNTIKCAISLEILHTASLIHDDVVDESNERRNQPSVNALWNNKVSILAGDYLLSLSLSVCNQTNNHKIMEKITQLGKNLSEGELLQITNIKNINCQEDKYLEVIKKKTAALFETCTYMGAVSTNCTEEEIRMMEKFGEIYGICFQIKDDIFDFISTHEEIGKPVGNDIREGKITLPLIYALNKNKEEKEQYLNIIKNKEFSKENIKKLIDFTINSGGIEYAEQKIQEYIKEGEKLIENIENKDIKNSLIMMLKHTAERKK